MFYNCKKNKILFHCLITEDEKEEFEQLDLHENIDVNLVVYDQSKNENYRLYDFLSNFKLEDTKIAPWTLKIDDDCYNNINLTCKILKKYDFNKNYYLVGKKIRKEMHVAETKALINCNLFDKINKFWTHELECCIMSQETFSNIIQNKECIILFKEFSKINEKNRLGYTDQLLGAAAKLCNIFPVAINEIIYNGTKKNIQNDFQIKYIHFHPTVNIDIYQNILKTLRKNNKTII
jgi:hypothetical protein